MAKIKTNVVSHWSQWRKKFTWKGNTWITHRRNQIIPIIPNSENSTTSKPSISDSNHKEHNNMPNATTSNLNDTVRIGNERHC